MSSELEPPFPSPPARPPKFGIVIVNEKHHFHTFYALYAAKHFLNLFLDAYPGFKWLTDTSIALSPELTVRSDQLEAIIEHTFSEAEAQWMLPVPYPQRAAQIMAHKHAFKQPTLPVRRVKRKKSGYPSQKTKTTASASNLTHLREIAEKLSPPLSPREARAIARKHIDKPERGWMFPKTEVEKITSILKTYRRK